MEEEFWGHDGGFYLLVGRDCYMVVEFSLGIYIFAYLHGVGEAYLVTYMVASY